MIELLVVNHFIEENGAKIHFSWKRVEFSNPEYCSKTHEIWGDVYNVSETSEDEFWCIESIYVPVENRGKGIGSGLVKAAIDKMKIFDSASDIRLFFHRDSEREKNKFFSKFNFVVDYDSPYFEIQAIPMIYLGL